MKIDGKQIAAEILADLKQQVLVLKQKNITPHLYIILLSDDASSASYVRQKMLRGEEIGVKITLDKVGSDISTDELIKKIEKLNSDSSVHGIIVQRPMPKNLNDGQIAKAVNPKKDIDGFNPNSKFETPVAQAVLEILKKIQSLEFKVQNFNDWIKAQKITVIGKGLTAGGPIINLFRKMGLAPFVIDSKTIDRDLIIRDADIVISAVGKQNIVNSTNVKNGVILIGVGMHMEEGKLCGDYSQEEIENIASFYTATPGGVGPVNVAMLLKNLVEASQNQSV